jgi:hypothetical protein
MKPFLAQVWASWLPNLTLHAHMLTSASSASTSKVWSLPFWNGLNYDIKNYGVKANSMTYLLNFIRFYQLGQQVSVGVPHTAWWPHKPHAEHCGQMVSTPASYSEGCSFKYWPGDQLSWLRFFEGFLSPSIQITLAYSVPALLGSIYLNA